MFLWLLLIKKNVICGFEIDQVAGICSMESEMTIRSSIVYACLSVISISISTEMTRAEEFITLTENTHYILPTNRSLWQNGSCTINSENNSSLQVSGEEGSGKFIGHGTAVLENLGGVYIHHSTNTWSDLAGGKNDATGYGYGGVFSARTEQGDSVCFNNNGFVTIKNIVYDCSDWGDTHTLSAVYGGAVYAPEGGSVQFCGNGMVELAALGSRSVHDSNYCYKDFYGYGGAVYAPLLTISDTVSTVHITGCYINQGVCTDVEGYGQGGSVYVDVLQLNNNKSNILFDGNYVHVANNAAGGALCLTETGTIKDNLLHVQFSGNEVTAAPDRKFGLLEDSVEEECRAVGGAISVDDGASLTFSGNVGNVTFAANKATADYTNVTNQGEGSEHWDDSAFALGGAVYLGTGAQLVIENNGQAGVTEYGNVNFSNNGVYGKGTNAASAWGGAVYMASSSSLVVQGNSGAVSFSGNTAIKGAGIYAEQGSLVSLADNANGVSFSHNAATDCGGAVYAAGSLFVSGNDSVLFEGNSADKGGAVYAVGAVEINHNGAVYFKDNEAASGSALYAETGARVNIIGNDSLSFSSANSVNANTLVYLRADAELNLCDNDRVSFAAETNSSLLYGEPGGTVNISRNAAVDISNCETISGGVFQLSGSLCIDDNTGAVSLSDNAALTVSGGVICLEGSGSSLSLSGNRGVIRINNNYAGKSGAFVYAGDTGSSVRICDNADVAVSGNAARDGAGAIDTAGSLHIRNNSGKVIFGNNSVYDDASNTMVLKSIRAGQSCFSAADGGSLEFRDAVSIGGSLELNADYNNSEQRGEIVFTGQYVEQYALLYADNNVAQDVSRHSVVEGDISLLNGTLKVADYAVLQGESLSVQSGENALLVLSGGGRISVSESVLFGDDTMLQSGADEGAALQPGLTAASPEALIRATPVCGMLDCPELTLADGSSYSLYGGILDLSGALLRFAEGALINLSGINTPVQVGEDNILLLFSGVSEFEVSNVTLNFYGQSYGDECLVFDAEESVVYLRVAAIPEPTSAMLSLAGITLLMMRRRRRENLFI